MNIPCPDITNSKWTDLVKEFSSELRKKAKEDNLPKYEINALDAKAKAKAHLSWQRYAKEVGNYDGFPDINKAKDLLGGKVETKNEPVKVSDEYHSVKYNNEKKIFEFKKEPNAKPVKLSKEGDFYYTNRNGRFTISDGKTGGAIVLDAKTLKDAKAKANDIIENGKNGVSYEDATKSSIEKYGLSPRYEKPKVETTEPVEPPKPVEEVKPKEEQKPTKTETPIKEKYNKIADNILDKYLKKPDGGNKWESQPNLKVFPYQDEVWNAGVKALAESIREYGDIAQAISDGISKIKESKWYAAMNKQDQKDALKYFSDTFDKEFNGSKEQELKNVTDDGFQVAFKVDFLENNSTVDVLNEISNAIQDVSTDVQGSLQTEINKVKALEKKGTQAVESYNQEVDKLANKVIKSRNGTMDDLNKFLSYVVRLKKDEIELNNQLPLANGKDRLTIEDKIKTNLERQSKTTIAARLLGRQSSSIFRALQAVLKDDYSYAALESRRKKVLGVDKLTPEQEAEVIADYTKYAKLKDKYDKLLAKHEKMVQDIEKARAKKVSKKAVKTTQDIDEYYDTHKDEAEQIFQSKHSDYVIERVKKEVEGGLTTDEAVNKVASEKHPDTNKTLISPENIESAKDYFEKAKQEGDVSNLAKLRKQLKELKETGIIDKKTVTRKERNEWEKGLLKQIKQAKDKINDNEKINNLKVRLKDAENGIFNAKKVNDKKANAIATDLRKRIKVLEKIRDTKEKTAEMNRTGEIPAKKEKEQIPISQELEDAMTQLSLAQIELKNKEKDILFKNRPDWEKNLSKLVEFNRGMLLLYPTTFVKITGAVAGVTINKPAELIALKLWHKITPKRLSDKADLYGNPDVLKDLAFYYKTQVTHLIKSGEIKAFQDLKKVYQGEDFRSSFENKTLKTFVEFGGKSHAFLKDIVAAPEFALAKKNIMNRYIREGREMDLLDPKEMEEINRRAMAHSMYTILMNKNMGADYVNANIRWIEKNMGVAAGTFAKTQLPIVRVPSNYIARTFTYTFGLPKAIAGNNFFGLLKGKEDGSSRLAGTQKGLVEILFKADQELTPEQANFVYKNLSKGTVGLGYMALGLILYNKIAPLSDKDDNTLGKTFKKYMLKLAHSPMIESMFMYANIMNAAEKSFKEKGEKFDALDYAAKFMEEQGQLIKKAPMVNYIEYGLLPQIFNAMTKEDASGKRWGRVGVALIQQPFNIFTPGFIKDAATWTDTSKMPEGLTKKQEEEWNRMKLGNRRPDNMLEAVYINFPFLINKIPTNYEKQLEKAEIKETEEHGFSKTKILEEFDKTGDVDKFHSDLEKAKVSKSEYNSIMNELVNKKELTKAEQKRVTNAKLMFKTDPTRAKKLAHDLEDEGLIKDAKKFIKLNSVMKKVSKSSFNKKVERKEEENDDD